MRRPLAALVAVTVAAAPACTFGVRRAKPRQSARPGTATPTETPSRTPRPTAGGSASPAGCPADYAAPDPKRPRIRLAFVLGDDGRTVTGTEQVTFTPDLPVRDVVFRAWPNSPGSVDEGGRLEVTSASLPMTVEKAGAGKGAPGTLVRLALPAESPAGKAVTVDLSFRLRLPHSSIERYGYDEQVAWWGSGHPLLAWQRGRGWATEPAAGILGETAASEAADYTVDVVAPARYTVVGNGLTGAPQELDDGRLSWSWHNPVARDVAVVAGRFEIETFDAGGTPVLVAVERRLDPATTVGPIRANLVEAMTDFRRAFGRYPYDSLTVVALRAIGGAGVEYPGLFFVGNRRYDVVVPHELAHEWFYGLVGNNQAVDPWLDEAFATYGEALVNGSAYEYLPAFDAEGDVGAPMTYWNEHAEPYGTIVYSKGAAALLLGREESGRSFDEALRCYVRANAYAVATPGDLRRALAGLRSAVALLEEAGAL
ncbi:MAG TPA: M1 family aminopeptidase [Mycobacteriales bacterium]